VKVRPVKVREQKRKLFRNLRGKNAVVGKIPDTRNENVIGREGQLGRKGENSFELGVLEKGERPKRCGSQGKKDGGVFKGKFEHTFFSFPLKQSFEKRKSTIGFF